MPPLPTAYMCTHAHMSNHLPMVPSYPASQLADQATPLPVAASTPIESAIAHMLSFPRPVTRTTTWYCRRRGGVCCIVRVVVGDGGVDVVYMGEQTA